LSDGGIYAYWYAQLLDRYLTLSKKPTVYGTSFGSYMDANGEYKLLAADVIDPENMDKRRAKFGIESKEVTTTRYAKEAKQQQFKVPTYRQAIEELDQVSVAGGYLQQ